VSYFGSAAQNQTLSAVLPDDVPANLLAYRWESSTDGIYWTAIASAVSRTFTLSQAQVGSQIRVLVTTVSGSESAVQNTNDLPVGAVEITGASATGAAQGDKLVASTAKLSDLDGMGQNFVYQWQIRASDGSWSNIAGATAAGLTLTQNDVASVFRVQVSYTDAGGTQETVFSAATAAIANANDAPTGQVNLALQGEPATSAPAMAAPRGVLVASNTLDDIDGLGPIQYQWQQSGLDAKGAPLWTAIDLATAETLSLESLVGKSVRVQATYTDGKGTVEKITSSAVLVNDAATGDVSIAGGLVQGQTLTASNNLQDANGMAEVRYQWLADGKAIEGATSANLVLAQAQVGKAISVQASFKDLAGTMETVRSVSTAAVANVDEATTGTLGIAGVAQDGKQLAAVTAGLVDSDGLGSYAYQWQTRIDSEWRDLQGATKATLDLTQAHVGQTLRLRAVHTDLGGYSATLTSDIVNVLNANDAATGAVTLDGVAQQRSVLRADTSTIADVDGLGTLHYHWESQTSTGAWTTIAGANASTLALTADLGNQKLRSVVSFTDGFEATETLTSGATIPFKADDWTNSTAKGSVFLAGYTLVGQKLTASNTLTDADWISSPVAYKWQVSGNGTTGWKDIAATKPEDTLTLTLAQQGKYVRAVGSFTDGFGGKEEVFGEVSAKISHANYAPRFAKTVVYSKVYEGSVFVSLANATNTDPGDTVTYSVTGKSADLFHVVNGSLQFINAPDFEGAASQTAKNVYRVELVATDAFGASAKQSVHVKVLNVNESPVWTHDARTFFVKEGGDTLVTKDLLGANVQDGDLNKKLKLTLGGADADLFKTSVAGKLWFTSAAAKSKSASADGDYRYELELIATDSSGLSTDTQYLSVQTVTQLGTATAEALVGTAASDSMAGLGGNDTLTGGAGADSFFVSEGHDRITDLGNGADVLNVAAGAQATAQVSTSWTAGAQTVNLGTATLTASASIDLSAVTSGNGFVIDAAAANLTLTGSRGADTFVLQAGMVDTVLGFESGKDSISFKGLEGMVGGSVASKSFTAGAGLTAAATADQYLVLNTTTGALYFDADGSGNNATATLLAQFSPAALPTWSDMRVDAVFGLGVTPG
jgi:hypothetical protein